MTVFRYLILSDFVSVYSLVLVSIEKVHQTIKTVLDHISKHLKVCQKFSTLFSVFRNVVKHGLSCLIYRLNWFWIIAACYLKCVYNYKCCTSSLCYSTLNLFHLFYQSFCVALSLWPESQSLYCWSESHSNQYHHRNPLQ